MPFIPHTELEIQDMLAAIGVKHLDTLFEEIPKELRCDELTEIAPGLTEMAVTRLMQERAGQDPIDLCFIGAGAYEHHIPAAVWQIATRGEFYSAYTPYQAEASQGTLQVIYEYQSMMTQLMAMDVSNASLYDGASALGEAILMAVRANRQSKKPRILMPRSVHPHYRRAATALVEAQGIEIIEIPFDPQRGAIDPASLAQYAGQDITALVIPQPNFFGVLEDVDTLTDWAHKQGALVIAQVNPLTTAVLQPPGAWGKAGGVDIACGEGQPLGVPLAGGGPYYGFMCCRQEHVRQMPGRIAGRTVDLEGRTGFTLTLQPREQHIRRAKATSNICTNQGLAVTASTIYMAMLGAEGLARVAAASHQQTQALRDRLTAISGVKAVFKANNFHEIVLQLPKPVAPILARLTDHGVQGGFDLSLDYPELGNSLLICVTETKTNADLDHYAAALQQILSDSKRTAS